MQTAEVHTLHPNRMSDSDYDRERERLRQLYGDSPQRAGVISVQVLAAFYASTGWTQKEIAAKEKKAQHAITYLLRFGRFLNNITSGDKVNEMTANLTERAFRAYWNRTAEMNVVETERFHAVEKMLIDAMKDPKPKPKPVRGGKTKREPAGRRGDSTPQLDKAMEAVRPLIRDRATIDPNKLGDQIGVSHTIIDQAIGAVTAENRVYESLKIDPEQFSKTGKMKLDTAIRVEKKRLQQENEVQFQNRIAAHIEKLKTESLPRWAEDARRAQVNREYYERLINNHQPPLTYDEYMLLHLCVRGDASADKRNQAGVLLNAKRDVLTKAPK